MIESYVDPYFMILYLEDKFNMNIELLKEKIMEAEVNLDDVEVIIDYDIKFRKEYPDVYDRNKLRREYCKKVGDSNFNNAYNKYMENFVLKSDISCKDKFITLDYEFDNTIYNYYKKSISVLKDKCMLLLLIISKLADKDIGDIKCYIDEIDIDINNNLDINEKDVIRLIKPTIYNINALFENVEKANNSDTYKKKLIR